MATSTTPHNAHLVVQRQGDTVVFVHDAYVNGVMFQARTPLLAQDEASCLWELLARSLRGMSASVTCSTAPDVRYARLTLTTKQAINVCDMLSRDGGE